MQTHNFEFTGKTKEYFAIWIVNILLTIVTFGIYSAWATVRTNQYFYDNTCLDGDRFSYLAKPVSILIGRIIAAIGLGVWVLLNISNPVAGGAMMLIMLAFFPVLYVRSIGFELKMTQYRNIRFNFNGRYGQAYIAVLLKPLVAYIMVGAAIAITAMVLKPISMVLTVIVGVVIALALAPFLFAWVIKGIHQYTLNNTRYGDLTFSSELSTKDIFPMFLKFLLMLIITVALFGVVGGISMGMGSSAGTLLKFLPYIGLVVMIIYIQVHLQAELRNYIFSKTTLNDEIQFKSSMTINPCVILIITNILLLIVSLGFAFPFIRIRTAKYIASISHVDGDLATLKATEQVNSETGAIADEVSTAVGIAFETA
ncbi:putative membrane protein [Moritella sp. JT01]|uniref:YjgN family protein n=1 Tax=Moritella sp. JT01 TaxID=756698 RepID=UPI00079B65D7|nr:YjgN family protein [Moritella sp. JT01]KXO08324.1 putative membrane protein [Moritella sp. JT01]